jgi:LacI family transcriptional regulator
LKKKINIKDVAKSAGVHASTVSRVMNPHTRSMVSAVVAERIMQIASDLGYARSPLASGLRTGRTHTIGVLIPDLTNPVFPPIVRGIERTLAAQSYTAILADSDNTLRNERAIVETLKSRHIDGLIFATALRKDPVVSACIEEGVPVVLVNRTLATGKVNAVVNDDAQGISDVIHHLVGLGHRRIAFVGGPQNTSTGFDRYRAFKKLVSGGVFRSHDDLQVNCDSFTVKEGHQGLLALLRRRKKFTAVVAANDTLALGCYDALRDRQRRCPEDISVTGFNGMPYIGRLSPPLTSVHVPLDQMGVAAAELLLKLIQSPERPAERIKLDPQLVVRGSTAPPAGKP